MESINQHNSISKMSNSFMDYVVLFCIPLSFVLSDWVIDIFSFGEIIIALIMIPLVLSSVVFYRKIDTIILVSIISIILFNVIVTFFFNTDANTKATIAGAIKILFFLTFVISSSRYIIMREIKNKLLLYFNIITLIVLIIGIYIFLILQFNLSLPYEFFWTFGRTDYQSYYFRGPSGLVRMRSIFNEPAHLGYFLNSVLLINIFNLTKQINKVIISIICLGIILTFSYSAIVILLSILILKLSLAFKTNDDKPYGLVLFSFVIVSVLVFIFKEIFYEAIYLRTIEIITGSDNSFMDRIYGSWQYLNRENILFGEGIGNTSTIWNNYAYVFTDIGILGFIVFSLFSLFLVYSYFPTGIIYILLNFQRGGYLGPSFWLLIMLYLIYFVQTTSNKITIKGKEN